MFFRNLHLETISIGVVRAQELRVAKKCLLFIKADAHMIFVLLFSSPDFRELRKIGIRKIFFPNLKIDQIRALEKRGNLSLLVCFPLNSNGQNLLTFQVKKNNPNFTYLELKHNELYCLFFRQT